MGSLTKAVPQLTQLMACQTQPEFQHLLWPVLPPEKLQVPSGNRDGVLNPVITALGTENAKDWERREDPPELLPPDHLSEPAALTVLKRRLKGLPRHSYVT